jgi:hypothetical protein
MADQNVPMSPDKRKCPRCDTINDFNANNCSKCSLDFNFLDYTVRCFSGRIPQETSVSAVLKPGEIPYYSSNVTMLNEKTEVSVRRNYLGTRFSFAGVPLYVGQSSPQKESHEILVDAGSGEFVITNQTVIIVGGKANYNIPLSKIMDFGFYGNAVQIFNEGRHGGTIYKVGDPWRLWVILVTILKVVPSGNLLKTTDWHEIGQEDQQFILHLCEQIEQGQKITRNRELTKTFLESSPATVIWLILCPPIGFYSLYKNTDFGGFMKLLLTVGGLYSLGKWISFFNKRFLRGTQFYRNCLS